MIKQSKCISCSREFCDSPASDKRICSSECERFLGHNRQRSIKRQHNRALELEVRTNELRGQFNDSEDYIKYLQTHVMVITTRNEHLDNENEQLHNENNQLYTENNHLHNENVYLRNETVRAETSQQQYEYVPRTDVATPVERFGPMPGYNPFRHPHSIIGDHIYNSESAAARSAAIREVMDASFEYNPDNSPTYPPPSQPYPSPSPPSTPVHSPREQSIPNAPKKARTLPYQTYPL
tara:strand:+ start:16921 stop:17631 length:711 start_codon:yes stop_codon:yes gene_type:complete